MYEWKFYTCTKMERRNNAINELTEILPYFSRINNTISTMRTTKIF